MPELDLNGGVAGAAVVVDELCEAYVTGGEPAGMVERRDGAKFPRLGGTVAALNGRARPAAVLLQRWRNGDLALYSTKWAVEAREQLLLVKQLQFVSK